MRYIDILLLLLLSFSAIGKDKNDLANMGMKGHVKQFTCTMHVVSDSAGVTLEKFGARSLFYFSKAGNATEVYYYNSKGDVFSSLKYTYNKKDQYEQMLEYKGDTLVRKRVYVYKNNIKSETFDYTGNGKLFVHQVFQPNKTGETRLTYDSTGKLLTREIYKCDANDNVLSHTTYGDHWMDIKEEQTFNSAGHMTSQSSFAGNRDGTYTLQNTVKIVSDSLGNEIERTTVFDLHNSPYAHDVIRYTYTYDKAGNTLTKKDLLLPPNDKMPYRIIRCEYIYY